MKAQPAMTAGLIHTPLTMSMGALVLMGIQGLDGGIVGASVRDAGVETR